MTTQSKQEDSDQSEFQVADTQKALSASVGGIRQLLPGAVKNLATSDVSAPFGAAMFKDELPIVNAPIYAPAMAGGVAMAQQFPQNVVTETFTTAPWEPHVRLSDAQAAIAKREAELADLRERNAFLAAMCREAQILGSDAQKHAALRDLAAREARLRATGMGGLLSEILGKGALSHYGDSDLIDRVKMAVSDHESALAQSADSESGRSAPAGSGQGDAG